RRRHHEGQAGPRAVGANLLRRVRRPPAQAGAGQGNRGVRGLSAKESRMDDHPGPETAALIDKLRAYWIEKEVLTRPGVSLQEVQSFESRYLVRLPSDLRNYYTAIDGMEDGATDPEMFSFLPLKAVRAVPEELAHFGGIPDYREIVRSLA